METQKLEIAAEIVIERCKAEIGKEEVRSGDRNCKLDIERESRTRMLIHRRERSSAYQITVFIILSNLSLSSENWKVVK